MPTLHQYDYIFAIGTIFAFLDAWNIGANDVANSWATSVGSRTVTYLQAMGLASVMEFGGAVGVGARVADTIRTKVVKTEAFKMSPAVLMLGMMCAVVASSLYLTLATRLGMPVSTTHSIMGGVIGMGIAALGGNGIQWIPSNSSDISSGVTAVFLAWLIAPGIAGVFGAIIFTITKYGVMLRKNPAILALWSIPVYFGITAALIIMLLLWKGGGYTINLTDNEVIGVIIGGGAAWGLLVFAFLGPFIYRKVILNDWQIKPYHFFLGPALLFRGPVPPAPEGWEGAVQDYYRGRLTKEQLEEKRAAAAARADEESKGNANGAETKAVGSTTGSDSDEDSPKSKWDHKPLVGPKPEGPLLSGAVLFWYLKYAILRGVDRDVVNEQSSQDSVLSGDIEGMHATAKHFDNKSEYIFTFLQVMTAATASFTHGANDVSNAIGPYATIFQIWNEGALPAKDKAEVPVWILVFGGAAIVIGLWTYGYNIMRNLGNRMTLMSPSRGFSMELGSACTVIMATRLKLPISTTQCITGATVGVGLCNGEWRSINWRMVAWIYFGWIITLPVAGLISGLLMGIIINAPRFGLK